MSLDMMNPVIRQGSSQQKQYTARALRTQGTTVATGLDSGRNSVFAKHGQMGDSIDSPGQFRRKYN